MTKIYFSNTYKEQCVSGFKNARYMIDSIKKTHYIQINRTDHDKQQNQIYLSSGVSSMTGNVEVPDMMEGPSGSGISTVIVLDTIPTTRSRPFTTKKPYR